MTHYCEDEEREKIALKCIKAIQPYRGSDVEFILVTNGFYKGLREYTDQYFEREADSSPGRSVNIGARAANGDLLVVICNDVEVFGNWLEECKEIVLKYPKYFATPVHENWREKWWSKPIDGRKVNERHGSNCLMLKKEDYFAIGGSPEVSPAYDGSELTNRWVKMGYSVILTKENLANDLAFRKPCYLKQQKLMGYK